MHDVIHALRLRHAARVHGDRLAVPAEDRAAHDQPVQRNGLLPARRAGRVDGDHPSRLVIAVVRLHEVRAARSVAGQRGIGVVEADRQERAPSLAPVSADGHDKHAVYALPLILREDRGEEAVPVRDDAVQIAGHVLIAFYAHPSKLPAVQVEKMQRAVMIARDGLARAAQGLELLIKRDRIGKTVIVFPE